MEKTRGRKSCWNVPFIKMRDTVDPKYEMFAINSNNQTFKGRVPRDTVCDI